MVTVTTATAENRVDMSDASLVDFLGLLTCDPTLYGWISGQPAAVALFGSGFTYTGADDAREATGGVVSSIVIDVDASGPLGSGDLFFGADGGRARVQHRQGRPADLLGRGLGGHGQLRPVGPR